MLQEHNTGEYQIFFLKVPGRLYPISLEYHAIPCIEDSDRLNPAPYVRILQVMCKVQLLYRLDMSKSVHPIHKIEFLGFSKYQTNSG